MCRLSIIVPIYNVEKYLHRCIESLIHQKVEEYEILLVNDGAKDESPTIAEEYSKEYPYIKTIHQKNKGLSGARNTGLIHARGKYVMFIDSDDWIVENSLNTILEQAESCELDVGVADFQFVNENGEIKENEDTPFHSDEVMTGGEYLKESLKTSITMMVWKSIYSRKFLIENNLFFREGFNHEDEEWMPRVYLAAKRVKDISRVFYCYFIHTDCISKNPKVFAKNSFDLIENCYVLKKTSMGIEDKDLKQLLQNRIVQLYLSAFYKGKLLGKKYNHRVNRNFFQGLYFDGKTKQKVALFKISKYLYYYVNRTTKYFF